MVVHRVNEIASELAGPRAPAQASAEPTGTLTETAGPSDSAPLRPDARATSIVPRLMTVPQLAAFLAVSERTAKRMVAGEEVPGIIRLGRSVRIDRAAVEVWIGRGCPRVRHRRGRP